MPLSRRRFIRLTIGVGLVASSGYIFKDVFLPAQLDAGERRTFESFLETLIPSDETPGALQLGVGKKILEKASQDVKYRRLMRDGCAWLNRRARERAGAVFLSLDESRREDIVGESAGSPAGSVPRIFFERMRSDAFFQYYAHPAAWKGLGYKGPPQPDGYPDYTSPQSFRS